MTETDQTQSIPKKDSPQQEPPPTEPNPSSTEATPDTPAEEPPAVDLDVEKETSPPEETSQPESTPSPSAKATEDVPPPSFIQTLLIKARAKIQERKQKKLDKIIELLETKPQITNQDVQKLLRISRATSFRYLDILEKQNKIKQVGNTGKWVFYSKT